MIENDPNEQLRVGAPAADERPAAVSTATSAEERVRAALGRLDGLEQRPLPEHAPAYEALHDDLQAVLAEIDGG